MLQIKDLTFSYGTHAVLEGLHLTIKEGQLVALTGLSGSGKSTLLKLIYGSLAPNNGQLFWKKEALLGPDFNLLPGAPFMRYLAQDFDLMPYTSVAENISQHLSVFEPEALAARCGELLRLIDMEAFAKVPVKKLSGGQQQRVALAKVLAKAPQLLLLDEPFSHIDPPLKSSLRNQLYQYLKKYKIACLLASHHPEDYMGHAHEIVCLQEGKIAAKGTPEGLYNKPPSISVAKLFGTINKLPFKLSQKLLPGLKNADKKPLLIWPHEWEIDAGQGNLAVRVSGCFFRGGGYEIELSTAKHSKLSERTLSGPWYAYSKKAWPLGSQVYLYISLEFAKERLSHYK